jgi:HAD superfamily hydrolase (TIGR01509 family)
MTEISLILLDLNGVLYHYDREARVRALASTSLLSPALIKAAIWDSGFEDRGDAGAFDAEAYLQGFGAAIGCNLSEAEWITALRAAITPIQEALELVRRIRTNIACAVLTNNNLLVRRHFSTLYPEVAARVGKQAYVSAEFGARKPDPDVYRRCLANLGAEPAAALFIDDSQPNVAGARAAGLAGHHSACSDDLMVALQERGLLD